MRKSVELQRLREANRRNRERRLRRWKDNTKTVPPKVRVFLWQVAHLRQTVDALAKSLQPAIKQIQDCVGLIPAVFWGGYRNE